MTLPGLGASLHELTPPYPGCRWPSTDEELFDPAGFSLRPELSLVAGESVFTIGSCFARNIEDALFNAGFRVPMRSFSVPETEWETPRRNGIINRFTPQSIVQLLSWALDCSRNPDDFEALTSQFWVELQGVTGVDLDFCGFRPVTRERFLERRRQLLDVTTSLTQSKYAIVTLGQTESWYSEEHQLHWCQVPVARELHRFRSQTRYHALDDEGARSHIRDIVDLAHQFNPECHVIMSVSPVPANRYWSGEPALRAYWSTKMTLWRAARDAAECLPQVHYFPSFEAVRLHPDAFMDDRIHVSDEVVRSVVEGMLRANCDVSLSVPRRGDPGYQTGARPIRRARRSAPTAHEASATLSQDDLQRILDEGRVVGYRRDGLFARLVCYLNVIRISQRLGLQGEFLWERGDSGANRTHGYSTDMHSIIADANDVHAVVTPPGAPPDSSNMTAFKPLRFPDEPLADAMAELREIARSWRLLDGQSLGWHLDQQRFAWGLHARQGDSERLIWMLERYFPEAGWREIVADLVRECPEPGSIYLASDHADLVRRFRLRFSPTLTSAADFEGQPLTDVPGAFWDAVRLSQSTKVISPANSNVGTFVSLLRGIPHEAPEEFMGIGALARDLTRVALSDYVRDLDFALEAGHVQEDTPRIRALKLRLTLARRRLKARGWRGERG